jgi:hypothetical protein
MLLPSASRMLALGVICQTMAVVILVAYLEKAGGRSDE